MASLPLHHGEMAPVVKPASLEIARPVVFSRPSPRPPPCGAGGIAVQGAGHLLVQACQRSLEQFGIDGLFTVEPRINGPRRAASFFGNGPYGGLFQAVALEHPLRRFKNQLAAQGSEVLGASGCR